MSNGVDDIVVGGPTPVTIVPELLVLRPEVARLHPGLSPWVPFGDFLAHDIDGILNLAS